MKKAIRPNLLIFIMVNTLVLVFARKLEAKGIDPELVLGGNIVLFLATLVSFWMHHRAMNTKHAGGIMRNVFGAFIAKFFIILIAAFAYIFLARPVNKYGIFVCMSLYFVYTFAGIRYVLKQQNKPTTDAEGKTSV